MLTLIHGPQGYLNDHPDGPFAFANATEVQAYNNTFWLYDYAVDNRDCNGGCLTDWDGADHLLGTYALVFADDETSEQIEQQLTLADLTPRGVAILDAMAGGQDAEPMLTAWREDLYGS